MRGRFVMRPSDSIMSKPAPSALTLPRLPPGMMMTSGTDQSNCWTISMPTVFWPSSRRLFIEFARYTPSSTDSRCTMAMQPSKSVSSESTSAPLASGCTSRAVRPFGALVPVIEALLPLLRRVLAERVQVVHHFEQIPADGAAVNRLLEVVLAGAPGDALKNCSVFHGHLIS